MILPLYTYLVSLGLSAPFWHTKFCWIGSVIEKFHSICLRVRRDEMSVEYYVHASAIVSVNLFCANHNNNSHSFIHSLSESSLLTWYFFYRKKVSSRREWKRMDRKGFQILRTNPSSYFIHLFITNMFCAHWCTQYTYTGTSQKGRNILNKIWNKYEHLLFRGLLVFDWRMVWVSTSINAPYQIQSQQWIKIS